MFVIRSFGVKYSQSAQPQCRAPLRPKLGGKALRGLCPEARHPRVNSGRRLSRRTPSRIAPPIWTEAFMSPSLGTTSRRPRTRRQNCLQEGSLDHASDQTAIDFTMQQTAEDSGSRARRRPLFTNFKASYGVLDSVPSTSGRLGGPWGILRWW